MVIFHKSNKHSIKYNDGKFNLEIISLSFSSELPPPNYTQTIYHNHPCLEIHFVLCGQTIFELADKTRYTVNKGEFIIIPTFTKHRIVSESNDFRKFAVMFTFSPKNSDFYNSVESKLSSTVLEKQNEFMLACAMELISFAKSKIGNYSDEIRFTFLSFILNIFHTVTKSREDTPKEEYNDRRINEAIDYIDKNISAKLTVNEVAEHLYISSKQLTRIFERILSITPGQYIINMRSKKISNLLLDIDYSLEDISDIMQYNEVTSMIKFFKRSEGITPQKFRKSLYKF